MPSPPKPWERAGATAAVAASSPSPAATQPPQTPSAAASVPSSSTAAAPSVPARPSTLTATNVQNPTSQLNATAVSPYASPYSSPYNRFASTSMYGGMGSYGMGGYPGGYGMGGYGSGYGMGGYGTMGGYGGMGMQPPYDPNNPSLTQQLEATTHSTFALIQSIVQTFGGFAQMLESTYMATHSSFFAMVGVAEQLGQLRNALGSVLGLFGMIRWLRGLITGRPVADGGMSDEFSSYLARPPGVPPPNPNAPKPSKKPLIFFLLAVVGIPFLMHRLIRSVSARLPPPVQQEVIDPSKLVFAKAAFAFDTKDPVELSLREGEIVAILRTVDPVTGVEGAWWRGRTRDGREGWFPRDYVQVLTPTTTENTEAKRVE